jgi:hypothetical protein
MRNNDAGGLVPRGREWVVNKHFRSIDGCFLSFTIPTSFEPRMKQSECKYASVEFRIFRIKIADPVVKSRSLTL